jgi:hypothetical protein
VVYAAGGGGAGGTGGAGGSSIGGAGASSSTLNGSPGAANTGSGGGGNFALGNNTTNGGNGGSGVVILSYGPVLEVIRTATVARAGSNFSQSIQVQLRDTGGVSPLGGSTQYDVTVTATGQVLREGTSGAAVTSVTVRTVNGVATFTDLGFTSNVGVGARTLTFTSDAFVGTSLTITPSQTASAVNITASGTTDGVFVNGNFESATDGTANIVNTVLQTHMQSFSTTIESRGTISVQAGITSSASGNGSVNINIASNNNANEYSLGDKLK